MFDDASRAQHLSESCTRRRERTYGGELSRALPAGKALDLRLGQGRLLIGHLPVGALDLVDEPLHELAQLLRHRLLRRQLVGHIHGVACLELLDRIGPLRGLELDEKVHRVARAALLELVVRGQGHHVGEAAEELEKAHDEFCLALQQLFDAHKKKLGYGDRQLEML